MVCVHFILDAVDINAYKDERNIRAGFWDMDCVMGPCV